MDSFPSDNRQNGYLPIESYGVIGNMRTAAMVGTDASVDFMCFPKFDSPSLFCRLLDRNIGGHYQITPTVTTLGRQQYMPNSNVLTTRFLAEEGASQVIDFFHVSDGSGPPSLSTPNLTPTSQNSNVKPLYQWLIRVVEMVRGTGSFRLECFPAFNYGRDKHTVTIKTPTPSESLQYYMTDTSNSFLGRRTIMFESSSGLSIVKKTGMNGPGVIGTFELLEGQQLWFVLREASDMDTQILNTISKDSAMTHTEDKITQDRPTPKHQDILSGCDERLTSVIDGGIGENNKDGNINKQYTTSKIGHIHESDSVESMNNCGTMHQQPKPAHGMSDKVLYYCTKWAESTIDPPLSLAFLQGLYKQTLNFWHAWIGRATYIGRWREIVRRSALTLKLLTYEPTGAVIAALTFSLPEEIGGPRNWDYRYVWVRDSAFTIYALIRVGLIQEARSYLRFIELVSKDRNKDGSLNVMYTIDGKREIPETELDHLEGYKGSKPVRVGNGAATHLQLDIYGALMDAIYLMNKFSSPVGYDMWVFCRSIVNYVCANWHRVDMSIWEVRSNMMNFVYSKVMCWVAIDRGLRLAEKRVFPCPDRVKWLEMRDKIYEEIMTKGWNAQTKMFVQSYENHILDSSILIMPLVFFISPTDPRLVSTINAIMRPPEKQGGLTSNNLVHRYNHTQVDDGLNSKEGAFTMCTFWLVEALTRAGKYDPHPFLDQALLLFEQLLSYGNNLGLFSEEVASSGELLGNFPQAFTHIALISAAFNLDRVMSGKSAPDDV